MAVLPRLLVRQSLTATASSSGAETSDWESDSYRWELSYFETKHIS